VNDEALAAFCLPLGPESQTLKDRMAHEVWQQGLSQYCCSKASGQGCQHVCSSIQWRMCASSVLGRR
jgi:hypothetical protein